MLNSINIVGRLAREPALAHTPSGTAICTLVVATNDSYTDSTGARREEAQFHTVLVFGKQGEAAAQYLIMGQEVAITGRLTYRKWTDDRFKDGDGNSLRRVMARILASRVTFGAKPQGTQTGSSEEEQEAEKVLDSQAASTDDNAGDSDLPL